MFGIQRPVAPWADHHWWGQYESPAELPNVAGAQLQLSEEVQAGDMAWSLSDQQLYVCLVPTKGAALWNALFSLIPSNETTNLYVAADAATASDTGPGTIAEPLATIDEALRRTNRMRIVTAPVIIHMAEAAAGYIWTETLGPLQLFQPVAIVGDGAGQGGDGFTELQASKASAAGTGQRVVVDPDGGLVVNVYQGKTIIILSGAAAGDRRTIRNNTATDIVPCYAFSAAVAAGDTFRIVEPAVVVGPPATLIAASDRRAQIRGCGAPGTVGLLAGSRIREQARESSVVLQNLRLTNVEAGGAFGEITIQDSRVYTYGVELVKGALANGFDLVSDTMSLVSSGVDKTMNLVSGSSSNLSAIPHEIGILPSPTAGVGWGLSSPEADNATMHQCVNVIGHVVIVISRVLTEAVNWHIQGGAFRGYQPVDLNDFLCFYSNSRVWIGGVDPALRVLVEAEGSDARTVLILSSDGSYVRIDEADLTLTGDGVGVLAGGWHASGEPGGLPGVVALPRATKGMSISAPRVAVGASYGGRVSYDNAPTLPVAPSVAEIAVWQGSEGGAPTATQTFAGLADGASIVNTTTPGDGSCVMRVT